MMVIEEKPAVEFAGSQFRLNSFDVRHADDSISRYQRVQTNM
jgi:hypothetical protein